MRIPIRLALIAAALLAACSNTPEETGTGTARLGIVNAAIGAIGGQLLIDNEAVALPSTGAATTLSVDAGAHQIRLLSAAGAQLADTSFAIPAGGRRTAVFTGTTSVTVSITRDTITTNAGGGYHSIVGSMLFVHAAPGAGPYDILIHQMGTDSTVHVGNFAFGAGSLPPPAPYGFYVPFVPATYRIQIVAPGTSAALATLDLPLATDERWIVTLMSSIEGELVLQAVKQP